MIASFISLFLCLGLSSTIILYSLIVLGLPIEITANNIGASSAILFVIITLLSTCIVTSMKIFSNGRDKEAAEQFSKIKKQMEEKGGSFDN
jgi:hypothetical protein